jgi:hypothetical protein
MKETRSSFNIHRVFKMWVRSPRHGLWRTVVRREGHALRVKGFARPALRRAFACRNKAQRGQKGRRAESQKHGLGSYGGDDNIAYSVQTDKVLGPEGEQVQVSA